MRKLLTEEMVSRVYSIASTTRRVEDIAKCLGISRSVMWEYRHNGKKDRTDIERRFLDAYDEGRRKFKYGQSFDPSVDDIQFKVMDRENDSTGYIDMMEWIDKTIQTVLTDREHEVVILRFFEECNWHEIEEITRLREKELISIFGTAIMKIRQAYTEQNPAIRAPDGSIFYEV